MVLAVLLPIVFTLPALDPPVLPDQKTTQAALDDIREIIRRPPMKAGRSFSSPSGSY